MARVAGVCGSGGSSDPEAPSALGISGRSSSSSPDSAPPARADGGSDAPSDARCGMAGGMGGSGSSSGMGGGTAGASSEADAVSDGAAPSTGFGASSTVTGRARLRAPVRAAEVAAGAAGATSSGGGASGAASTAGASTDTASSCGTLSSSPPRLGEVRRDFAGGRRGAFGPSVVTAVALREYSCQRGPAWASPALRAAPMRGGLAARESPPAQTPRIGLGLHQDGRAVATARRQRALPLAGIGGAIGTDRCPSAAPVAPHRPRRIAQPLPPLAPPSQHFLLLP
jgi:hypothetical protein